MKPADRAVTYWGPPTRRVPDPEAVVCEAFAQRDPIGAVRAVAQGLACQTSGSQVAALRMLAEALCRRDPSLAAEIANDLRSLAQEVTP